MKTSLIFIAGAALCIGQSASSQTSAIQVLQANYGVGGQQLDVTAKVQSLVQTGQTNIRVRNQLFGEDPMFGKRKTLTVLFNSNGAQYRKDIQEGEELLLSDARLVTGSATPAETTRLPTPEVATPQSHRLAPDGTLYLLEYVSSKNPASGTIIGIVPGTKLKLLADLGVKMRVKTADDYGTEVEVDTEKLTNDIDLAEWARKNDKASQAQLQSFMGQERQNYAAYLKLHEKLQLTNPSKQPEKAPFTPDPHNPLSRGPHDERVSPWYHGPFIYRVHVR